MLELFTGFIPVKKEMVRTISFKLSPVLFRLGYIRVKCVSDIQGSKLIVPAVFALYSKINQYQAKSVF